MRRRSSTRPPHRDPARRPAGRHPARRRSRRRRRHPSRRSRPPRPPGSRPGRACPHGPARGRRRWPAGSAPAPEPRRASRRRSDASRTSQSMTGSAGSSGSVSMPGTGRARMWSRSPSRIGVSSVTTTSSPSVRAVSRAESSGTVLSTALPNDSSIPGPTTTAGMAAATGRPAGALRIDGPTRESRAASAPQPSASGSIRTRLRMNVSSSPARRWTSASSGSSRPSTMPRRTPIASESSSAS